MPTIDAALYLPISAETLNTVLDEEKSLADVISGLPVPQVACLIVIQCLATTAGKPAPTAERMLAETIDLGNETVSQHGPDAFTAQAQRFIDREKIRAGCDLLSDHKILLLSAADVRFRNYLTADRRWNLSFCELHRAQLMQSLQRVTLPRGPAVLNREQTAIFQGIKGHIDEPLHVQGYAGTGKSFLIASTLTLLQERRAATLVLAEHKSQLNALLARVEGIEGISAKTYGELILEMIPDDLMNTEALRMLRTKSMPGPTPDEAIIRYFGIRPSRAFSELQIARAVRETERRFCYSDDTEIGKHHLPYLPAMFDDDTTRLIVLHWATELWKTTIDPRGRDFNPHVRDYHRLKWAALNGLKIPSSYTHILIDECHNIAKPMLQILERSLPPAFTFGDSYQNLQGEVRNRTVLLNREVTQSVRAGRQVEGFVNSIIAAHPCADKPPFHGDPVIKTEVVTYTKVGIPEQRTTVLVSDLWALFEWAQRLAREMAFELLSDAQDLHVFVLDCIELYQHGTIPRHDELFHFSSWNALAKHYQNHRSFERIESMLQKGFNVQNWLNTRSKFTREPASGYALGMIKDVRNREFDSVMLTPDVVDWVADSRTASSAEAASTLYVATTRARHRLIVPERMGGLLPSASSIGFRRGG